MLHRRRPSLVSTSLASASASIRASSSETRSGATPIARRRASGVRGRPFAIEAPSASCIASVTSAQRSNRRSSFCAATTSSGPCSCAIRSASEPDVSVEERSPINSASLSDESLTAAICAEPSAPAMSSAAKPSPGLIGKMPSRIRRCWTCSSLTAPTSPQRPQLIVRTGNDERLRRCSAKASMKAVPAT